MSTQSNSIHCNSQVKNLNRRDSIISVIMELDLAKKEGWTCPNPGCNVHYAKKGKYIVSSWPVDGNSKVLDSCIICVLSSLFKKRENINLARPSTAMRKARRFRRSRPSRSQTEEIRSRGKVKAFEERARAL